MVFYNLIFLIFALNYNAVASGQKIYPSNAVAEVGKSAVLKCTTNSPVVPNWILSRDGGESGALYIALSCVIQTEFTNHYQVETAGGSLTCDLHVFNITLEQAGVYLCDSSETSYAILTIIDPNTGISFNNTQGVMEGEKVILTDSLTYNGSTNENYYLRPYLYWTNPSGQNVSSVYNDSITRDSLFSQIEVVAMREDIAPHTSHTAVYLHSTGGSNRANNTPGDIFNSNSPTIDVYYTPIITSPTPDEQPCEQATCIATANPPATYTWYVKQEDRNYTQSAINVTIGDYTCYACNTFRGNEYCDQVEIKVTTICNK